MNLDIARHSLQYTIIANHNGVFVTGHDRSGRIRLDAIKFESWLEFESWLKDKTMLAPSPKQQAVLDFIVQFTAREKYPPTYEEIRVGCGLSTKSLVDYHLKALEKARKIKRDPWMPRGIKIL